MLCRKEAWTLIEAGQAQMKYKNNLKTTTKTNLQTVLDEGFGKNQFSLSPSFKNIFTTGARKCSNLSGTLGFFRPSFGLAWLNAPEARGAKKKSFFFLISRPRFSSRGLSAWRLRECALPWSQSTWLSAPERSLWVHEVIHLRGISGFYDLLSS